MQSVAEIRRIFDASIVNRIMNHPEVRPLLGGDGASEIDVQELLNNPANIALHREGFAAVFLNILPGVYEVHTQALPEARAANSVYESATAMLHWIFTRSGAYEIVTRVPDGNFAARKLAEAMGFRFQFRLQNGWIVDGGVEPCDIFSLNLNDWLPTAKGLVEIGEEFHDAVNAAFVEAGIERAEHPSDVLHDQFAGAAYEMMRQGQFVKAVVSYNRWAALSGYRPIAVVSHDPLIVHIGDAAVAMGADGGLSIVKGQ